MDILEAFTGNGFATIDRIYTEEDIAHLLALITQADAERDTFRKSKDLFAIRQLLREVPAAADIIFNDKLKSILAQLLGEHYFVVKGIYFDKPQTSNWYVSWHQDLTISVDRKLELVGFNNWTVKQGQFAVQPPVDILENLVTVRIHLDDTDEENGALRVVPGSHLKGIYRPEGIDWTVERKQDCCVPRGAIMLMKPLLLHSSGRTTNSRQRRVIHLEFSNRELPAGLRWAERMEVNSDRVASR